MLKRVETGQRAIIDHGTAIIEKSRSKSQSTSQTSQDNSLNG